ncbi:hypothetical protein C8F04DRAFT_1176402 [Mycena alexandri]|uniref:Uncharacterized protein n=1 Tax=Mycena alexandri TaxID=1745969 RepID=A0AAD6TAW1_9AGAR|nr:hypothetical protein C8F04DRAFT_1176402 [Mycena alexandri]
MSPTKGTLYEYDMMLAITQDTINRQFKVLFDTDNPLNYDEKLIPHDMKLGYLKYDKKTKTWVESKEGVTATIECPTVDLVDCGTTTDQYRSVRIKIKMSKATLSYYNEGTLEEEDLGGHSVSWIAHIGQRNVQDLQKEAMTTDAKKAIEDALKVHKDKLPNEVFLVTSIFCLFESTQVANSFKFTDATGKDIADAAIASTFLIKLQQTYARLDKKDHPWVLGYGISVDIPKKEAGTPLFYPSKFWFSTTPLANDPGNSTLNYCIIDNGFHDENLVDPTKNLMAGVMTSNDKTFVDLTRASNLKSDGVMGFSKTQYINRWIVPEILDQCTWATELTYRKDKSNDDRPKRGTHKVTMDEENRKAHRKDEWDGDWVIYSEPYLVGNVDEPPDAGGQPLRVEYIAWSEKISGSSTVDVEYWSVLQDESGSIPIDKKRLVHLKMTVHIKLETQILYGETFKAKYNYVETFDWNGTFHISTGTDGRWTMAPEPSEATVRDGKLLSGGRTMVLSGGPTFSAIGDPLSSFQLRFKEKYISPTLKTIDLCVVMPAGNVFTFLGLDSDDTGNIYTHIKYKTTL